MAPRAVPVLPARCRGVEAVNGRKSRQNDRRAMRYGILHPRHRIGNCPRFPPPVSPQGFVRPWVSRPGFPYACFRERALRLFLVMSVQLALTNIAKRSSSPSAV